MKKKLKKDKTKSFSTTVRLSRNGEFENSEKFDVEIPENTKVDDLEEALMDALRPILQEEFVDDEDWENGDMSWTLHEWEETKI